MCRSLFVITRENCKIVFRQGAYVAVIFLFLIPYLHGIQNLNSEKVAGCLGQLVSLIGMPLFVSILKPEQDSDIRDIIMIKSFPYYTSIFLRMIFAMFLSFVSIYIFALYMYIHFRLNKNHSINPSIYHYFLSIQYAVL